MKEKGECKVRRRRCAYLQSGRRNRTGRPMAAIAGDRETRGGNYGRSGAGVEVPDRRPFYVNGRWHKFDAERRRRRRGEQGQEEYGRS